ALLGLARLASAVRSDGAHEALLRAIVADDGARARLFAVLGASTALGNALVARPGELAVLADPAPGTGVDARAVRAELLAAVGADPEAAVPVATLTGEGGTTSMRRAYRRRLTRI